MTAKSRKRQPFDLNSVVGVLRRQLNGALDATMVPMALGTLVHLIDEIDRLRSMLDVQEEEANKDKIVPLVPKEPEDRP